MAGSQRATSRTGARVWWGRRAACAWPEPEVVLESDPQDPPTDDLYTNGYRLYISAIRGLGRPI